MSGRFGGVFVAVAAAGWLTVGSIAALAQTKPAVTSLGPDFPKTTIFIGNSYLADIDAPTARFLQTVAWETVQDYYGR